jgi:PAS domain S-box-containing protein
MTLITDQEGRLLWSDPVAREKLKSPLDPGTELSRFLTLEDQTILQRKRQRTYETAHSEPALLTWKDTQGKLFPGLLFGSLVKRDQDPLSWLGEVWLLDDLLSEHPAIGLELKLYQLLFQHSPIGVLRFDGSGVITDCNQEFCKIIGSDHKTLIGLNMLDHLNNTQVIEAVRESLSTGYGEYQGLYHSVTAHKSTPVRALFYGLRLSEKACAGGIGLVEDLQEHLEVTKDLRKSNRAYRDLFEHFLGAIYILNHKGVFLTINSSAEAMYGYARHEIIGKTPEFLSAEGKNNHIPLQELIDQTLKGSPQTFEFWGKRKNGTIFPKQVQLNHSFYDGQPVVMAFARDITVEKQEAMVQGVVFEIARTATTAPSPQIFYQRIERELSKIINTDNLFIGLYEKSSHSIHFPFMMDQKDQLASVSAKGTISALVLESKQTLLLSEMEMRAMTEEGLISHIGSPCKTWLGVPLIVEDEAIGLIVVQDYQKEQAFGLRERQLLEFVSSQIAIFIAKKRREETIRLLSESVQQGPTLIGIADLKKTLIYANQKFQDFFGLETPLIHHPCPILSQIEPTLEPSLEAIFQTESTWRGERLLHTKPNHSFWANVSVTLLKEEDPGQHRFLLLCEDITEQKRLEQQLRQAQKMESIGTMTGGIAHDFNNLLTVISGHTQMALKKLSPHANIHKDLEAVHSAAAKAKKLTSQLLAYSRKQLFTPQVVELNRILEEQLPLVARLIGEDIAIVTRLTTPLASIKADPNQIEQILMNLLINARDAIREQTLQDAKKQIVIETAQCHLDRHFVVNHTGSQEGEHVVLSVTDSGVGMTPEIQAKIFDPFFTTKDVDKGTGLGLSTVYGITKQNKGSIYVYSEPGLGTTVKIYWPITTETPQLSPRPPHPRTMPYGQKERILIVEDDASVREMLFSFLQEIGYSVQQATNGREALNLLEEWAATNREPALLLTDLVMPEINGRELATKALTLFPNLKIMFCSGYAEAQLVQQGELASTIHFLQKPFNIEALAQKIRSILEAS